MRTATLERNTKETQIKGRLKIEGRGRYDIATGIGARVPRSYPGGSP